MKKKIAALLVLSMVLLCASVSAENTDRINDPVRDRFDSIWRNGFDTVEINCMDGYWDVEVSLEGDTRIWHYFCVYSAEQDALVSDSSVESQKIAVTRDENGVEIDRTVLSADAKASFSLNEKGKLIWKDEAEDAGAGMEFEKTGWFEGTFVCDNYLLIVNWDVEVVEDGVFSGYKLVIEQSGEASDITWLYSCGYNPENNTLEAFTACKEIQEAGAEAIDSVYDAVIEEEGKYPAVFSWNEEGSLIWTDNLENAGDGLAFMITNG